MKYLDAFLQIAIIGTMIFIIEQTFDFAPDTFIAYTHELTSEHCLYLDERAEFQEILCIGGHANAGNSKPSKSRDEIINRLSRLPDAT